MKNNNTRRMKAKYNGLKVVACSLLMLVGQAFGDITLKSCDEYGHPTTTFTVGIPGTLEVTLADMLDITERPTVQGLDQIYARDSNSMMTMSINGKTTIKYSYRVRFDAAGTYTVGPATVEKNGQTHTSNTVTINVVDQPAEDNRATEKNKSSVLFVRMKVDKDKVVVGEKFKCILRCYYTDQVSQVSPSSSMQLAGFIFEDGVEQATGVETMGGINYSYFDLSWNVHATEPGKKTIPAYSIDYIVSNPVYSPAIAMMFGHSFGEKKRAYSNVVSLNVDPLPIHNGPVHAIGSFTRFSAKIDPAVAKQGEGMVLTLELLGQGNFDKNHPIELQGLPSEFKYYDSKQYTDGHDRSKKYFEFIVQGLATGEWQFPPQKFTFFDTKSRTYKTLETESLSVKIMANQRVKLEGPTQQANAELPLVNPPDIEDDIRPIRGKEVAGEIIIPSLPWWLMLLLVIVPSISWGYAAIKNRPNLLRPFRSRLRKKNAFVVARKEIKNIFEQKTIFSLSTVFVQLFAARCSVDESAINQEFILHSLRKAGIQEDELEQWNQFYNQLNELKFFNKPTKPNEALVLQHYATHWINRLEEVL